jgi:hypothetical protein
MYVAQENLELVDSDNENEMNVRNRCLDTMYRSELDLLRKRFKMPPLLQFCFPVRPKFMAKTKSDTETESEIKEGSESEFVSQYGRAEEHFYVIERALIDIFSGDSYC